MNLMPITAIDKPTQTLESLIASVRQSQSRLTDTHSALFDKLVQLGFVPRPVPEPCAPAPENVRTPTMLEVLAEEAAMLNQAADNFAEATRALSSQYKSGTTEQA